VYVQYISAQTLSQSICHSRTTTHSNEHAQIVGDSDVESLESSSETHIPVSMSSRNRLVSPGPLRASGTRETIITGPCHYLIPYALRSIRDIEGVEREKCEEGCPFTIQLGIWGIVISSPSGVRGAEPGRKWILCIFHVRKRPSGTPFSVFLSDAGPQTSRGQGKLPPSPPLSMGLRVSDDDSRL